MSEITVDGQRVEDITVDGERVEYVSIDGCKIYMRRQWLSSWYTAVFHRIDKFDTRIDTFNFNLSGTTRIYEIGIRFKGVAATTTSQNSRWDGFCDDYSPGWLTASRTGTSYNFPPLPSPYPWNDHTITGVTSSFGASGNGCNISGRPGLQNPTQWGSANSTGLDGRAVQNLGDVSGSYSTSRRATGEGSNLGCTNWGYISNWAIRPVLNYDRVHYSSGCTIQQKINGALTHQGDVYTGKFFKANIESIYPAEDGWVAVFNDDIYYRANTMLTLFFPPFNYGGINEVGNGRIRFQIFITYSGELSL